jgi:arylsulfatase A-like enzyme
MTGRYNYRTGVTDTWLGRAMMHADEVTLAEMLKEAGYHTGIFGKWHLGDSYPMRPQDQGFDEVLYPGEIELRREKERLAAGIEVDDKTWSQLLDLADKFGIREKVAIV